MGVGLPRSTVFGGEIITIKRNGVSGPFLRNSCSSYEAAQGVITCESGSMELEARDHGLGTVCTQDTGYFGCDAETDGFGDGRSRVLIRGWRFHFSVSSGRSSIPVVLMFTSEGIPPVNRNLTVVDAWVTVLCKKLATWWPWVAEGENPLKVDNGKEIQKYKALDPINRVMILKALCEVRVQQDDVLRYIADELKKGTEITAFRKERIGGGDGVSYWCDGDPVIGHRLYKEVGQVESKQKSKGKGCAAQPTIKFQWETLATDFDEFQQVSVNLSSSKINDEASVSELVKTEIIPVLEKLQKKKEKALKRQQRQALELNDILNYSRYGVTRSCRERRPVRYTFDEYDRTIDEAIQVSKKSKTTGLKKDNAKQGEQGPHGISRNGKVSEGESEPEEGIHDIMAVEDDGHQCDDEEEESEEEDEDAKYQVHSDDDDFDENSENHREANIEDEEDDDDSDSNSSDAENGDNPKQTRNPGLRQSQRFVEPANGIAETKKRLRQRLTRNSAQVISDSEDGSSENENQAEAVSDSEMDE